MNQLQLGPRVTMNEAILLLCDADTENILLEGGCGGTTWSSARYEFTYLR
jgi:hypothetical protein